MRHQIRAAAVGAMPRDAGGAQQESVGETHNKGVLQLLQRLVSILQVPVSKEFLNNLHEGQPGAIAD